MIPLQSSNTQTRQPGIGFAFKTGLAFRPFFWLGAVFLLISFALWAAFWQGNLLVSPHGGMIWWHQHEMLFGFAAAIVVGFLLTAVQNWTGIPSFSGPSLWALAALWLLARFFMLFPMGIPAYVLMVIDVAFLPIVAIAMGRWVIQSKRWRNLIFAPVLLIFTAANIGQHLGAIYQDNALVERSSYLAVWVMLNLIILLGGRVIPFFTSRAVGVQIDAPAKWREMTVLCSALGINILFLIGLFGVPIPNTLLGILLALTVVFNLWRWSSWKIGHCWHEPLLWGLHISYLFVIIGAFLWLLSLGDFLPVDYALHLLTIGGILGIILAMTARVSLGHTGRPIKALPGLSWMLIAIFIAAIIRGPFLWIWPDLAATSYQISLLLGFIAYLWFVARYTIPLWSTRIDGRPG
ncbi:MAG TPA: NnrS family protein [Paenalcaligenes sp.]|nr:NnrS family protein [Paenalcaligenes sp.]